MSGPTEDGFGVKVKERLLSEDYEQTSLLERSCCGTIVFTPTDAKTQRRLAQSKQREVCHEWLEMEMDMANGILSHVLSSIN